MTGCIYRCNYTKYFAKPLYDSNFDNLKYFLNKTDGASMQVTTSWPLILKI